jgi:hypothetical protein
MDVIDRSIDMTTIRLMVGNGNCRSVYILDGGTKVKMENVVNTAYFTGMIVVSPAA